MIRLPPHSDSRIPVVVVDYVALIDPSRQLLVQLGQGELRGEAHWGHFSGNVELAAAACV